MTTLNCSLKGRGFPDISIDGLRLPTIFGRRSFTSSWWSGFCIGATSGHWYDVKVPLDPLMMMRWKGPLNSGLKLKGAYHVTFGMNLDSMKNGLHAWWRTREKDHELLWRFPTLGWEESWCWVLPALLNCTFCLWLCYASWVTFAKFLWMARHRFGMTATTMPSIRDVLLGCEYIEGSQFWGNVYPFQIFSWLGWKWIIWRHGPALQQFLGNGIYLVWSISIKLSLYPDFFAVLGNDVVDGSGFRLTCWVWQFIPYYFRGVLTSKLVFSPDFVPWFQ